MESPAAKPPARARKSGVVNPHRTKWPQRLAARLIWLLIRSVTLTLRHRTEGNQDFLAPENSRQRVIFAVWHNRLAVGLPSYEHHVRGRYPERRLAGLVSASRDGGLLARTLELFHIQPVRGSSSRRGPQALLELTRWAEQGCDLAITPDGPRGPRYVVQGGIIAAAQLSGLLIIPVSYHAGWKFALKSWDRFQIPLPFSSCLATAGEALRVPRDADEALREELRAELERRLRALTRD